MILHDNDLKDIDGLTFFVENITNVEDLDLEFNLTFNNFGYCKDVKTGQMFSFCTNHNLVERNIYMVDDGKLIQLARTISKKEQQIIDEFEQKNSKRVSDLIEAQQYTPLNVKVTDFRGWVEVLEAGTKSIIVNHTTNFWLPSKIFVQKLKVGHYYYLVVEETEIEMGHFVKIGWALEIS